METKRSIGDDNLGTLEWVRSPISRRAWGSRTGVHASVSDPTGVHASVSDPCRGRWKQVSTWVQGGQGSRVPVGRCGRQTRRTESGSLGLLFTELADKYGFLP